MSIAKIMFGNYNESFKMCDLLIKLNVLLGEVHTLNIVMC